MRRKLLFITLTATLLGAAGSAAIHYYLENDHKHEFWFHLLTHAFSLIGSAGLVGFVFEFVFRTHAIEEFSSRIIELFDGDPHLAAALSQEARQRRVRNTLEAQLGKEIGHAIYDGLVSRYLSSQPPFRKQFVYEAILSDLSSDVSITSDLVLRKEDYYRLTMTEHFERPFRYTANVRIGCILTDDFSEVNYWFTQDDCIFRDTLVLQKEDRERVKNILENMPEDEILSCVNSILRIDKISIDGVRLKVLSAKLAESGKSVSIQLSVPKTLRRASLARYEIEISGLVAREAGKYPVILGEPTEDPEITLTYQAKDIERIVAAPFFTGRLAFEPTIDDDEHNRRVRVRLPRKGTDHTWVFPNSGAIFLWDRHDI